MMVPRIAIFGAGAIGVYLAGKLAQGGVPVRLIARPEAAAQIARAGLVIDEGEERLQISAAKNPNFWVGTAAEARRHVEQTGLAPDALLITTKSQQIVPALAEIAPLLTPQTLIACLQNGIPWWYLQGLDPLPNHPSPPLAALAGHSFATLDPEGVLPKALPPQQVSGVVIHKSAEQIAPGHVEARRVEGDRFLFGSPLPEHEPAGEAAVRAAFEQAGLRAEKSTDIRHAVWEKLLGNAVLNPLSALTGASVREIVEFPLTRQLGLAAMEEALTIAAASGVDLQISLTQRLERARAVGDVRTSMLQDKIRARPLEVEGILGTLLELAHMTQTAAPRLKTLHAATALLSQTLVAGGQPSFPFSSTGALP
ncbi:MAG: 2-dehydropantoate 2-reductase [Zoogloeaceae bacterium]|jgi:2-dehydropantoate 2-reductase|nr:2-dehydropantoate 2-reductase [Zoogloeaceae bacterium]